MLVRRVAVLVVLLGGVAAARAGWLARAPADIRSEPVRTEAMPEPAVSDSPPGARVKPSPPVAPAAPSDSHEAEASGPASPDDLTYEARHEAEEKARAADEAARRRGKKTGLGSPHEKPEVITEKLLRAIARGKISVDRFLDPALAVLDVENIWNGGDDVSPGDHDRQRCRDARSHVLGFVRAMVRGEKDVAQMGEYARLTCSNEFAIHADTRLVGIPGDGEPPRFPPVKHVVCEQSSSSQSLYRIEWAPDAKLGWRIAAIGMTERDSPLHLRFGQLALSLSNPARCKATARR